jgi:hypothetical protein
LIGTVILLALVGSFFGQNLFWFFAPIEARLKPGDLQQFQLIRNVITASGLLIPSFLLLSALLWLLIGTSLFHYRWTAFVAQLAAISVLSFVVVQALLMPAVASEQSYKGFVESVARTHDSSGTIYVFPKGLDYSSIVFYGGNDLRLLPEDDDALMKKLAGSEDYVIMGEREWRAVLARSSLSVSPLLRSKGTGPDRDSRLILVRGAKS